MWTVATDCSMTWQTSSRYGWLGACPARRWNIPPIGRTTMYRWRDEDPEFCKAAEAAMAEGDDVINEMTEAQLFSLIKKEHFPAVQYRLRTHHPERAEESRRR